MTRLGSAGWDGTFSSGSGSGGKAGWCARLPGDPDSFARFRPYLAHFSPVFSRFLRVFTVSPRRFQRAPSRNPGPRNGGTRTKTRSLGPSFDTPDANQRINWASGHGRAGAGASSPLHIGHHRGPALRIALKHLLAYQLQRRQRNLQRKCSNQARSQQPVFRRGRTCAGV